MSEPFLGEIRMMGFNFNPRGWAKCDGQLLPISQNTALFSLLGTTYGGDGRTTFALPDLRGRLPKHAGNGPGLPQLQQGAKGGANTISQVPAHTHTASLHTAGKVADTLNPTGNMLGGGTFYTPKGGNAVTTMDASSITLSSTGSPSVPIDNPYLAINFCIALQGLFPSRS